LSGILLDQSFIMQGNFATSSIGLTIKIVQHQWCMNLQRFSQNQPGKSAEFTLASWPCFLEGSRFADWYHPQDCL